MDERYYLCGWSMLQFLERFDDKEEWIIEWFKLLDQLKIKN